MAKKISNEVLDSIRNYAEKGKGVVEIASLLKLSEPTVSKYMSRLGYKTDMSVEHMVEDIVRLFSEGNQIQEIANILGISRRTVSKYLQKEGITKTSEELRFGEDTEKAMCSMYANVQCVSEVARFFGASQQGVRKVLLRNGVVLRKVPIRELNTQPFRNMTTHIPEEVLAFLNKQPTKTSPKYAKAVSLFEKIDTEEKAYWLGFIYADGGIAVKRTAKLYFGVKESDKELLINFCRFIGIPEDSVKTVPRTVKGKVYNSQTLEIVSIPLCQSLIRKGVLPNKSLTLAPPTKEVLPKHLITHFIRGYFDGDGGINNDGSISITGTLDMVEWIIEHLGEDSKRKLSQKDLNRNTFTYRVAGQKAKEILNKLYLNCNVALDRKLSAYKSLCGFSQ